MHIIGLIIALATAIFWIGRAARGAQDIANAANTLKNMPRRNRFKKRASRIGLDLVEDPMDAATILMICVARLSDYSQSHDGLVSEQAQSCIQKCLTKHMQISKGEADELITQMRWTTKDLIQPDSVLVPMTNILSNAVNHADAEDLNDMLRKVSHADSAANAQQKNFITRFRNRIGLNG